MSDAPRLGVLLVDETHGRSALLEQALVDAGCHVIGRAHSLKEMQDLAQSTRPDLIIVDLESPTRDALESMASLHRDDPRPMVMFADRDDADTIQRAVKAGVSAYVVGGVEAKRVRPILEVAMARFREFQALRNELEETRTRLSERKVIDRAKGLLMQHRSLSEDQAYNAMRRMAMDQNQRLADVARNVIAVLELTG